jgi:hypothetical protein
VFRGFSSPNRRESPAEGFRLFAIHVNEAVPLSPLPLVLWASLRDELTAPPAGLRSAILGSMMRHLGREAASGQYFRQPHQV